MMRKKSYKSNMELEELRNLGKVSIGWLREAGIHSREDLAALGPVEAYKRVKAMYPKKVSLNLLWGLEGALTDTDWRAIPKEYKEELRKQVMPWR